MSSVMPGVRLAWVSDDLFPFESRFFTTPRGQAMHYVDEGSGEPVVFVHGNPAWSFEFRHLITGLRSEFRCVAPDHIGFGLSSRSDRRDDHHPAAHAEAFAALLDDLDLQEVTLFLTDWGGPIGLDFARRNPDRVKRLILANTWCWPVNHGVPDPRRGPALLRGRASPRPAVLIVGLRLAPNGAAISPYRWSMKSRWPPRRTARPPEASRARRPRSSCG